MAKGRSAIKPADITDVSQTVDQEKFSGAMDAMRKDGLAVIDARNEADACVRAVALQIGYRLPADAPDADLIQRDISANMRRSVEACLEVGKGLAVLKAACPHGEFLDRLDMLGIEARVAQRFMQSAIKFSNAALTPLLTAASNQTKLFEMLVLDDEQIEELALTGQTGELALDEVATMSVKELRHALRELRADASAADEVRAGLHKRIDKLEREKQRIERLPADEALEVLMKEAAAIARDAMGAVRGNLRQALLVLSQQCEDRGQNDVFMAGLVGQVQADLNALREEFGLPDVSSAADQQLAAEVAQWSQD